VATLSFSEEMVNGLRGKVDPKDLPVSFAGYIVSNAELLGQVFDSHNVTQIVSVIGNEHFSSMPAQFYRRLGPQVVAALPEGCFEIVTSDQLALILEKSFTAITPNQFVKIPPAALAKMDRKRTQNLSKEVLGNMSLAQLNSLGPDPRQLPRIQPKDAANRAKGVLSRRSFLEGHPCTALKARATDLDPSISKHYESRCKELNAAKVDSWANIQTVTPMVTAASVMLLALLLI